MTFLAPWYFVAACGAAVGVVALHFLVTREPRTSPFPTVRFVPQVQVRSFALALELTDIPLLLLRVALVLLVGAALAQPRIAPLRKDVARVVAVDVSRAVDRTDAWRTLVERHASAADAIVAFGSSADDVSTKDLGIVLAAAPARAHAKGEPGSLSAGLIASLRAAARIRDRADEIELVLVSPLVAEERDAATLSIRNLWPGGIAVVRAPAMQAAARLGNGEQPPPIVEWADSTASSSWIRRTSVQRLGGIRAGDATLIYPFERRWRLEEPLQPGTRVIARWIDGEAAAVERVAGADGECVRSMGFALPAMGDVVLRPDFARFAANLQAPCREVPDWTPLPADFVAALRGTGTAAQASSIAPAAVRATPLAPWLLLAALVLLALEYPARRFSARRRNVPISAPTQAETSPELRAAA